MMTMRLRESQGWLEKVKDTLKRPSLRLILLIFAFAALLYTVYLLASFLGLVLKAYRTGYDKGYSDGYSEGYVAGYTNCLTEEWQDIYKMGYDDGYNDGYEAGYDEGRKDGLITGAAIAATVIIVGKWASTDFKEKDWKKLLVKLLATVISAVIEYVFLPFIVHLLWPGGGI